METETRNIVHVSVYWCIRHTALSVSSLFSPSPPSSVFRLSPLIRSETTSPWNVVSTSTKKTATTRKWEWALLSTFTSVTGPIRAGPIHPLPVPASWPAGPTEAASFAEEKKKKRKKKRKSWLWVLCSWCSSSRLPRQELRKHTQPCANTQRHTHIRDSEGEREKAGRARTHTHTQDNGYYQAHLGSSPAPSP